MISAIPYNSINRVATKSLGKRIFEAKRGVHWMKNQSTIKIKNIKWLVYVRTIDANDNSKKKTKTVSKSTDEDTVNRYLDCVKTTTE